MKKLQMLILLAASSLFAQIDTTDWYPLQIGNKWEYYGAEFGYSQVEVIGDTVMPNSKEYFIFSGGVFAWRFQRKVDDGIVYGYNFTNNTEYELFNFEDKEKILWTVPFDHYWGIFEINSDKENLLNLELPYRIFERATIDTTVNPPDTAWGYLIDAYPTRITKGLGITSYTYDLTTLVGVLINGVGYGTLVSVDEHRNNNIPTTFSLQQNYPNPFNPSTKIEYSVPNVSKVQLIIYNVLGQKVVTLVNEMQKPGKYEYQWNATAFSSGTYFIKLKTGNYQKIIKAVLLK
jgi:hypothetical protein